MDAAAVASTLGPERRLVLHELVEDVVELVGAAELEDTEAAEVGVHEALDPVVGERGFLGAGEDGGRRHASVDGRVQAWPSSVLDDLDAALELSAWRGRCFQPDEHSFEVVER